jgi:hypothetical protein
MVRCMGEWAIQVVGDAGIVERLAEALGPAARIQIDGDARFLIRPEWQEASDAHEVEALARALLKRANGLMRIGGEFVAPLRFGGVVYLGDDGARTFYDRATATMKLTASVQTKVIRADGALEAPSPRADPLREWLREAEGAEDLRDALSLLGDVDDWADLSRCTSSPPARAPRQKLNER